jgi:hypothetical protein
MTSIFVYSRKSKKDVPIEFGKHFLITKSYRCKQRRKLKKFVAKEDVIIMKIGNER